MENHFLDDLEEIETSSPKSINSLEVELVENENVTESSFDNQNNIVSDENVDLSREIEENNMNNPLINAENIPEVEAQPLNFFNTNIPMTIEQYLSMQHLSRQTQREQTEELEIEKYYICNCIPCNKETSCIDKTCEVFICMCCPLNLGCKICGLGIFTIFTISATIEKLFCPDFGKVIFGINELLTVKCPLTIMEKCCNIGTNSIENEHNE